MVFQNTKRTCEVDMVDIFTEYFCMKGTEMSIKNVNFHVRVGHSDQLSHTQTMIMMLFSEIMQSFFVFALLQIIYLRNYSETIKESRKKNTNVA